MKRIKINEFLRLKRIEAGWTQSELSKALGYTSPQYVSNWERGLSLPPLKSLYRISKLLKIDPREMKELMLTEYENQLSDCLKRAR